MNIRIGKAFKGIMGNWLVQNVIGELAGDLVEAVIAGTARWVKSHRYAHGVSEAVSRFGKLANAEQFLAAVAQLPQDGNSSVPAWEFPDDPKKYGTSLAEYAKRTAAIDPDCREKWRQRLENAQTLSNIPNRAELTEGFLELLCRVQKSAGEYWESLLDHRSNVIVQVVSRNVARQNAEQFGRIKELLERRFSEFLCGSPAGAVPAGQVLVCANCGGKIDPAQIGRAENGLYHCTCRHCGTSLAYGSLPFTQEAAAWADGLKEEIRSGFRALDEKLDAMHEDIQADFSDLKADTGEIKGMLGKLTNYFERAAARLPGSRDNMASDDEFAAANDASHTNDASFADETSAANDPSYTPPKPPKPPRTRRAARLRLSRPYLALCVLFLLSVCLSVVTIVMYGIRPYLDFGTAYGWAFAVIFVLNCCLDLACIFIALNSEAFTGRYPTREERRKYAVLSLPESVFFWAPELGLIVAVLVLLSGIYDPGEVIGLSVFGFAVSVGAILFFSICIRKELTTWRRRLGYIFVLMGVILFCVSTGLGGVSFINYNYGGNLVSDGEATYGVNQDGTLTFLMDDFSAETCVIPSEFDGRAVTAVGRAPGFWSWETNDTLHSVVVPDSVTYMGFGIFAGYENLQSLTLSCLDFQREFDVTNEFDEKGNEARAEGIGSLHYLFGNEEPKNADRWMKIEAKHKGTYLTGEKQGEESYFSSERYLPRSLTSVTVTGGEIPYAAFLDCSALTQIVLPEAVTSIGERAFEGCSGLTQLSLPDSVVKIGEDAFKNCGAVQNRQGLSYVGHWLVLGDETLTEVRPEAGTVGIANHVFESHKNVVTVALPDSVKYIGDYAFAYCSEIGSLTLSSSLEEIGESAFRGNWKMKEVTLPRSLKAIKKEAFYLAGTTFVFEDAENWYYADGNGGWVYLPSADLQNSATKLLTSAGSDGYADRLWQKR